MFNWLRRQRSGKRSETSVQEVGPRSPLRRVGNRIRTVGIAYTQPSPYDTEEGQRLDFQHFAFRAALGGNYLAPFTDNSQTRRDDRLGPYAILDVGAGTGRWAREMAQYFPNANVIATDINEPPFDGAMRHTQATQRATDNNILPENYQFLAVNHVTERLPFDDNAFDLVHQRMLMLANPFDKWPAILDEFFRVTRPGGWVELAEGAYTSEPQGPEGQRFADFFLNTILLPRGVDPRIAPDLQRYLRNAGFINIRQKVIKLPTGSWGGRVGTMFAKDMQKGFEMCKPLFLRQGVSEEEFDRRSAQTLKEWNALHSSWPFYVIAAQKPIGYTEMSGWGR